jgi:hypothetical protein
MIGLFSLSRCLTNPIHLVNGPLNQLNVEFQFNVFILKIQEKSVLPIYRARSGPIMVNHFKSDLLPANNPFISFHNQVFDSLANLTKEEFINKDIDFTPVFADFSTIKDTYDGFKPANVPKRSETRTVLVQEKSLNTIDFNLTFIQKTQEIVMDISTKVHFHLKS